MQMRYALYKALQRLRTAVDWAISVETSDDIVIESAPGHANYLQIKHRDQDSTITNASSDLWKTIRIWSEAVHQGQLESQTIDFLLLTTSNVAAGSIASHLSNDENQRNESAALTALDEVAKTSTNQANAKAYASWLKLSDELKVAMLKRVTIVCNTPTIDAVKELIHTELALSVRRSQVAAFTSRLEGWWFQRCIRIFRSSQPDFITGDELDSAVGDLRESFLPENLPLDIDIPHMTPELDAFQDHRFVQQVDLVGVSRSRIASAVRDYLRAYTQRSRWIRESLILPYGLEAYEMKLTEEWRYVFDRCLDELDSNATEEMKNAAARQIYQWVEEAIAPPIRERCTEPFLVRGSLHMLADRANSGVGWHPDFEARLMKILEPVDQ